MADENDNDDNVNDDDNKGATTEELASLIKAQAARISELESEATTSKGLKDEVSKLQEALGTQTSLTELVEQLKTMNAADNDAPTEQEKVASELQTAAEAGDMKTFRKLREAQRA